ncbi:MAG: PD-(D/E)XK nuclease family protein [Actinobacteria bacterium]|nr:PD-(D/E)XK nuclease family protein [Actinomycetota bacterium]
MFDFRPYPEFAWSISRQRQLQDCPRAYYYRYYLSHNGWLRDAPGRSKLAYRLSKLTGLDALLGQEIDNRARELEAQARAGNPLPLAAVLEERTRRTLRDAWRSSRDDRNAFETKPNSVTMLRCFYVDGCPAPEAETDRLNEKLSTCHLNLVSAPHWDRLYDCAGDGCVTIEGFAHFFLDGVKTYSAADLAYVHDGTLYLIDWKSGRPGDDDSVQVILATYCLIQANPELAELPVRPSLYYLLAGSEKQIELPPDLKAFVGDTVSAGIREMHSFLRDVESNAPLDVSEFPRRESGLCASCNYTWLCEGSAQRDR